MARMKLKDSRIVKHEGDGWALYLGKMWIGNFCTEGVARYFETLLASDHMLQYLVLGKVLGED